METRRWCVPLVTVLVGVRGGSAQAVAVNGSFEAGTLAAWYGRRPVTRRCRRPAWGPPRLTPSRVWDSCALARVTRPGPYGKRRACGPSREDAVKRLPQPTVKEYPMTTAKVLLLLLMTCWSGMPMQTGRAAAGPAGHDLAPNGMALPGTGRQDGVQLRTRRAMR